MTASAPLIPASAALSTAPDAPGLYAIFVDRATSLPAPFDAILTERTTTLIYLGQASGSVRQRLCDQELRHKNAATFFRSLGAVLGYRPPPGSLIGKRNQKNYKFSSDDKKECRQIAVSERDLSGRKEAIDA